MAADERLRQAELAAKSAHLVLEQFAQRLDQLHVHALGQAADIVMALDRDRRAAGERHALDHVGIERALRQKLDRPLAVAGDAARLRLEHVDEQFPDRLALGLRVLDARERLDERLRRVDMNERDVEMAAEQIDHFVRLALAQKPVVDEDAGELIADRLVNQHRRDRGIDAARQAADDPRLADLRADTLDLLFAEPRHRPVAFEAGDLEQEIGDEFRAVGRMDHLGMEHRRVIAARSSAATAKGAFSDTA